jgi:serine/threonine-protein kinase RsbW
MIRPRAAAPSVREPHAAAPSAREPRAAAPSAREQGDAVTPVRKLHVAAPVRQIHAASYPGGLEQVRRMRRDLTALIEGCPAADDVVLCASELAANAVRHSCSGRPGGTFAVRVEVVWGDHVRIAVDDDGGPWIEGGSGLHCGRGLAIVTALAADWGIVTGSAGRTVWALFGWRAGA